MEVQQDEEDISVEFKVISLVWYVSEASCWKELTQRKSGTGTIDFDDENDDNGVNDDDITEEVYCAQEASEAEEQPEAREEDNEDDDDDEWEESEEAAAAAAAKQEEWPDDDEDEDEDGDALVTFLGVVLAEGEVGTDRLIKVDVILKPFCNHMHI